MYKKGMNLLNEIAAQELGAPRRRPADPKRNIMVKLNRLAKRRGISLGAAWEEYKQKYYS